MSGEEPGPVMFTPGRAHLGPPPAEADAPTFTGKTTYQLAAYLAYQWAPLVEERLTGIEDNTYDLGDQVRALGHRVTVALLTTIAAIAALVAFAILGRG